MRSLIRIQKIRHKKAKCDDNMKKKRRAKQRLIPEMRPFKIL